MIKNPLRVEFEEQKAFKSALRGLYYYRFFRSLKFWENFGIYNSARFTKYRTQGKRNINGRSFNVNKIEDFRSRSATNIYTILIRLKLFFNSFFILYP